MVLLGLDLRYLMAGCLAVTLIYDIFTLKFPPVLTHFPLAAGLIYHFLHGSLKQVAIAFFLPFALYLIKLLKGHIALYDVLDFSMIGIIMGWPFCLVNILISKAFMAHCQQYLAGKTAWKAEALLRIRLPLCLRDGSGCGGDLLPL